MNLPDLRRADELDALFREALVHSRQVEPLLAWWDVEQALPLSAMPSVPSFLRYVRDLLEWLFIQPGRGPYPGMRNVDALHRQFLAVRMIA